MNAALLINVFWSLTLFIFSMHELLQVITYKYGKKEILIFSSLSIASLFMGLVSLYTLICGEL